MKTPEQIAREVIGADALAGVGHERRIPDMIAAIEADRAQRETALRDEDAAISEASRLLQNVGAPYTIWCREDLVSALRSEIEDERYLAMDDETFQSVIDAARDSIYWGNLGDCTSAQWDAVCEAICEGVETVGADK